MKGSADRLLCCFVSLLVSEVFLGIWWDFMLFLSVIHWLINGMRWSLNNLEGQTFIAEWNWHCMEIHSFSTLKLKKKIAVKEGNFFTFKEFQFFETLQSIFHLNNFFLPQKIGVYYQRREIHLYHISVAPEFHLSTDEYNHFAWLAVTSDRENLKPFWFVFSNARADFRMRDW